jgi:hypothetical protein
MTENQSIPGTVPNRKYLNTARSGKPIVFRADSALRFYTAAAMTRHRLRRKTSVMSGGFSAMSRPMLSEHCAGEITMSEPDNVGATPGSS